MAEEEASTTTTTLSLFPKSTHPLDRDIDLSTSAGTKAFNLAFEIDATAKRLELTVSNGKDVMVRINARVTDCRMSKYFRIPTEGTGVPTVEERPRGTFTTTWNDLLNKIDMLANHKAVTIEQVQAFACYNWGGVEQERARTDDFTIEEIDPGLSPDGIDNEARELRRLISKQQYRYRAEMLTGIIKGIVTVDDFSLFIKSHEDVFTFRDDDGDKRIDGFVLFKAIMNEIQPEVVVDVREKENKLQSLTLKDTGNNVSILTATMLTLWKEICLVAPGSYDSDRFTRELFRALGTTKNQQFQFQLTQTRSAWLLKKEGTDYQSIINEATTLYKNLESEGLWNKVSDEETKIIALTTQVEEAKKTIKALQTKAKEGGGGNNAQKSQNGGAEKSDWETEKIWRCKKNGKTLKKDGKDYVWCEKHNGGKGMYMPSPHDHDAWQKSREEKKANSQKKAAERRAKKDKAGSTTPATTASGKLTLQKNLVEALTTRVGVSDADAKKLAEDILADPKA